MAIKQLPDAYQMSAEAVCEQLEVNPAVGLKDKEFGVLNKEFNKILENDENKEVSSVIKTLVKKYKLSTKREKKILSVGYMLGRFIEQNEMVNIIPTDGVDIAGIMKMMESQTKQKHINN